MNNDLTRSGFYHKMHRHLEHPQIVIERLDALLSKGEEWEELSQLLVDESFPVSDFKPKLSALSVQKKEEPFFVNYGLLFYASFLLWEKYKEKKIAEEVFWNSIKDLQSKLTECKLVYNKWGTFVFDWFPGFYRMSRFGLGCLQYDIMDYDDLPYKKNGIRVEKGDRVYNCHIPSGRPFNRESWRDSYKKAMAFFSAKPITIVCNSWLLYTPVNEMLSPKSHIVEFANEFDIIRFKEFDEFQDAWRIFGADYTKKPEEWPADNSLRKAYSQRVVNKLPTGFGFGILVFDGENIINQ